MVTTDRLRQDVFRKRLRRISYNEHFIILYVISQN